jgi:hypothetical protein
MAVKLKQDNYYTKRPDINMLKDLAKSVNDTELPNIPDTPHVLLPPPEHSLLRNNFQIYSEELFNIFNNPDKHLDTKLQEELENNKKHYFLKNKRKEHADSEKDIEAPRKRQRIEEDDRSHDGTSNIQRSVNNFENEDEVMENDESEGVGYPYNHRDNGSGYGGGFEDF